MRSHVRRIAGDETFFSASPRRKLRLGGFAQEFERQVQVLRADPGDGLPGDNLVLCKWAESSARQRRTGSGSSMARKSRTIARVYFDAGRNSARNWKRGRKDAETRGTRGLCVAQPPRLCFVRHSRPRQC